ncbi:MAG TPA: CpsB/CapC family capsule biosynthesis tyrosine phosphatase [Flavobacteriaceae bacterium]|nr:CpsB/CapC family capsule biosynthesis tyrosine phosphatase [Flavobacteriaceae bacterium]
MNFFFNSKKKITPLLRGGVDIHCHILPGLDDGAKTMEETRGMLQEYGNLGYKKIIATPHILKGTYPNTKETIFGRFKEISQQLPDEMNLVYNAGAEYMLDEDFEIFLEEGNLLPLKDKYVLIEMSYFQQPANLQQLVFKMLHKGFSPILAHPERYNFINNLEAFRQLKKMGCLFQLNLLSLTDHYGPMIKKKAFRLLKNDLYDFMATDAHHVNHLKKIGEIAVPKRLFQKVEKLTSENAKVFM